MKGTDTESVVVSLGKGNDTNCIQVLPLEAWRRYQEQKGRVEKNPINEYNILIRT